MEAIKLSNNVWKGWYTRAELNNLIKQFNTEKPKRKRLPQKFIERGYAMGKEQKDAFSVRRLVLLSAPLAHWFSTRIYYT